MYCIAKVSIQPIYRYRIQSPNCDYLPTCHPAMAEDIPGLANTFILFSLKSLTVQVTAITARKHVGYTQNVSSLAQNIRMWRKSYNCLGY